MNKIVRSFVDNSFLVNLISVFMVVIGLTSLLTMKRDLIPQWKVKEISINAGLHGASPVQMEEYVTSPIEDSIQSFAGIKQISSSSSQGSSNITIRVNDELNDEQTNDLYLKIKSNVDALQSTLPQDLDNIDVENRKINSFWFSSLSVQHYDFLNPAHRAWLITTKSKLRKLKGIVEVKDKTSWPNITVKFSPEKLSRYNLKPSDVVVKIKSSFDLIPMGSMKQNGNTIRLQMDSRIKGPYDLNNIIIKGNASGAIVRLQDLAKVTFGFEKIEFKSKTNGVDSANIHLFKDLDTDTIDLKVLLEKLLVDLNKDTPDKINIIITGDGPAYVERQLNVLTNNGILGILLVIFSLFLFLGARSAVMTCLGLPLAYFATFTVLSSMGISIDIISVVGMILILGILVDDAIIVSEQYMQYLEAGEAPRDAALHAVKTTMVPITGTVITTIVAFLPILMAKGGLSDFLYAIPWVVIVALIMSWFESFFILPNHLAHFVKKPVVAKGPKLFTKVKFIYKNLLTFSLRFKYILIPCVIGFIVFSVIFAQKHVPMKFNLNIGSEKIRIVTALKKSSTIEETELKLAPLWELLKTIENEKYSYISGDIGFAYYNHESHSDIRFAQIDIRFSQTHPKIAESKKFILDYLEKNLKSLKTNDFEVFQVDKKIDGKEDSIDNALSVFVKGRDLESPDLIIEKIKSEALKIPETKNVEIDPKLFVETWKFENDYLALQEFNLTARYIGQQLSSYIQKRKVKEIRHKGQTVDIYFQIDRAEELNEKVLNDLEIIGNFGIKIKSSQLGRWTKSRSLRSITHKNLEKSLKVDIAFDGEKIKIEKFKEKTKVFIDKLQLENPALVYSVENADQRAEENKSSMIKMFVYCIGMILFVLALVLKSITQPFLICMAIPFGIIGVIWAFYFHGMALEVMAMVGVLGMAGVVVNDSLIMVDTINKRRLSLFKYKREVIVDGAASRLRPILLTSITTLGGVFPMAYGFGGDAGFTKPLALSMGWGLLFATSLTLVIIPCMLEIQTDIIELFYKVTKIKRHSENVNKDSESLNDEISFPIPAKEVDNSISTIQ